MPVHFNSLQLDAQLVGKLWSEKYPLAANPLTVLDPKLDRKTNASGPAPAFRISFAAAEWQAAMEALILVATSGGPTMFARIGVMRALTGMPGGAEMGYRPSGPVPVRE
jgi:hypothetical protein